MAGQNPKTVGAGATSAEALKSLANAQLAKAEEAADKAASSTEVPAGHDMIRLLRAWQEDQTTWHNPGDVLVKKRGSYPPTAVVVKRGADDDADE